MDPERVHDHPVLGPAPAVGEVSFTYRGATITARAGDTIAVALWAVGVRATHPGTPALYCGIGHCYACRVTVDGVQGVRACLVAVRAGMRVDLAPDPRS